MQFKNNTKQRFKTIQGLRSFKDTLPKNIKKIIKKKGHIFSETLNNWKYIVGNKIFQICYPKSFKNSNKFGVSTLHVMVKRGHEIDLEYSKKEIMDKMNSFFGYTVVEKLKPDVTMQNISFCQNDSVLVSAPITGFKTATLFFWLITDIAKRHAVTTKHTAKNTAKKFGDVIVSSVPETFNDIFAEILATNA